MGTRALWRFDEVSATQRPTDSIGAVAEMWHSPIKFGTADALRRAVGWGLWKAAWHCNQLTGNLLPAFGSPSLVPASSPIYGLQGPRAGSDLAAGFDSFSDAFTGGDNYDVTATDDLVGALVFKSQSGAANADLFSKWDGTNGWWLFNGAAGGLGLYVAQGATVVNPNTSTPALNQWHALLLYIDRVAGQLGVIIQSLSTGVVIQASGAIGAIGNISNAANLALGSAGVFGAADAPDVAFAAIGAGPAAAAGLHTNRVVAIGNLAAAVMSAPAVVDAAAGRGRSFVALSGHGFEGTDVVSGATLLTRDASVQALVRWDLAEQAAAGTWTLTKTGGTDSTWGDSGASSVQTVSGDGYVEVIADTTVGSGRVFGFSATDANQSYATIGYGFYLDQGAVLSVFENGAGPLASGTYAVGDVLRVERVGTTVTYKKNGIVFYTSGTPSSGSLLIDTAFYRINSALAAVQLVDAGVRKPITWQNIFNLTIAQADQRGTLYARGKGGSAAEYLGAGVELRVVNASQNVGELAWLWQDTSGVLKRQVGGHFAPPATGYLMLTATRRWVSSTKVILRYFLGDRMLAEIESADGSIGGGTTGTTTIGARFDGSVWGDFFDGVIDELRVVDYELAPEEIAATWDRISKHQPAGYRAVRDLFPPEAPISSDPTSRIQKLLLIAGNALGYGAAQAENVRNNQLPNRAYGPVLEEWEGIVDEPSKPIDSTDARRARVIGHMRQRSGVSIPGIKAALRELVATDTDNLEMLAFKPLQVENYRLPEQWDYDGFRTSQTTNWGTTAPSGYQRVSTLRKTGGANNTWDAGASSVETFAGDVMVEVMVGPSSVEAIFGLSSSSDASVSYNDIDFALDIAGGGTLNVYEGGVFKFASTWVVGDRVQVKRTGTAVTYHKNDNGTPFYTSASTSSGAVYVDTSVYALGAELFRVHVVTGGGFGGPGTPLTWQNIVGVAIDSDPLRAVVAGATDLQYTGAKRDWCTASETIPHASSIKLNNTPAEGFGAHLLTKIDPLTIPANGEVGVAFHDFTRGHTIFFGIRNNAGTYQVITERFVDWVSQGVTVRSTTSLVAHWLHLYHDVPNPGANGYAIGALTPTTWNMKADWSTTNATSGFTSYAFTHPGRYQWAVLYARTIGGAIGSSMSVDFADTRLLSLYGDRPCFFYAYRNPALAGTPDTIGAHGIVQGLKHANTFGTFITSKSLLCDSSGSGCDRGPMGGF